MTDSKPSSDLPVSTPRRLDQISTNWTLVRAAAGSSVTSAGAARNALVLRYCDAVERYVRALLPDPQQAADASQDVMLRLVQGQLVEAATPTRGRFRDFLKTAVRNVVRNLVTRERYRRTVPPQVTPDTARTDRAGAGTDGAGAGSDGAGPDGAERDPSRSDPRWATIWTAIWRQAVLDKTWKALEIEQQRTGSGVAFTVLELRATYPDDDSNQLAARLTQAAGRPFSSPAARQALRRARLRFADLLVTELARGLDDPTPAAIQAELSEVGLTEYVRDFLPPQWSRLQGADRDDVQ